MKGLALVLVTATLHAQVQAPPTPLDPEARRQALTERLAKDFEAQLERLGSQDLHAVVQRVMARLFVGSGLEPLVVKGLHSDQFEAVPISGHVYVPVELLSRAKDDDELAGMLAHAVAHSRRPLVFESAVKASIPLRFTWTGSAAAVPVEFRSLVAAAEQAADAEAIEILGRAGVNPSGLARYLERERADASRLAEVKSRVAAMGTISSALPKSDECEIVQAWLNEQNAKSQQRPTLRRPGDTN